MRIDFLGVGSSTYTSRMRNTSIAVSLGSETVLFDCGFGTYDSLLESDLDLSKIKRIFISHVHADHFGGLYLLLLSLRKVERKERLQIFCSDPEALRNRVLPFFRQRDNVTLFVDFFDFLPLEDSQSVVLEEGTKVSAFKVSHTYDSVGFLLEGPEYPLDLRKLFRMSTFNELKRDIRALREKEGTITLFKVQYPHSFFHRESPRPLRVAIISDSSCLNDSLPSLSHIDLFIGEITYPSMEQKREFPFHTTAYEFSKFCKALDPEIAAAIHTHPDRITNEYVHNSMLLFPRIIYPETLDRILL